MRSSLSRSAVVVLCFGGALLAGCMNSKNKSGVSSPATQIVDQIREVDLTPRFPQRINSAQTTDPASKPEAAVYYGDQGPAAVETSRLGAGARNTKLNADLSTTGALSEGIQPDAGDKGYELNFENTPVATVAKAILGDILGFGYTIDPRVQGTVSLSSGRPVPRKDLLFALESALRVSNIALLRDGRGYRIIPSAEAAGTGAIDSAQTPDAGYGISVIPLQFVSAQTLTKLLENFSAKAGMVRAEPSRNLLIIQGNGADRRGAIDTALSFDADWMRGQSVGIYPVSNSTPEPIISELERIIDTGEGGLSQNVVKLQPIGRQNAILVVTRKPEFLNRVSTWIKRLDKTGSAGTGVKVYRMRYGDARQVAALLNDVFLGGSSGNGLDSPINQLVPGGGMLASSSDRSNFGGSQQAGGTPQPRSTGSSQQPSASAPPGFETRFADASGGRSAQGSAGPPIGGQGRSASIGAGMAQGGPGPILPNVRISADAINNTLLIYANQEHYRIIERTLQQVDRPQLQVAIDATIAEITLNDELQYGVQFFLKSKDVGAKSDTGSLLNTAKDAVLSRVLPGFNFLIGTEAEPRLILDALHAVTDVKVLSTPSVVVIDNQFASLQVGDQIPITTRTAQAVDVPTAPVVNSIDYRNTGVILRVSPRINANGNVLLDIEQEISAVAKTPTAGTLTPTVSQRKVRSSIGVASGQTVLLAGLISERREGARKGIPGLDQIPVVGNLFSTHNSGTMQRTELIIFIRPQIIRHGVDASRIAEELRSKMQGFQALAPEPRAKARAR